MLRKLTKALDEKERAWRNSFGHDISDPEERKRSEWHFNWLDHAILRRRWHNFSQIAPGVYRSNHPNHARFTAYRDMGIRTVLNLRGVGRTSPYLFERESCEKLGLDLVSVPMGARKAPEVATLRKLIATFETLPKPFLMHCKSGADRTGLASALYLMIFHEAPYALAREQLSFRYLHIRRTKTGILDHFLDVYAARHADDPIPVRDWIETEYDPQALTESFARHQAGLRFWQGWRAGAVAR